LYSTTYIQCQNHIHAALFEKLLNTPKKNLTPYRVWEPGLSNPRLRINLDNI
jgi:hypothetical protein